MMTIERPTQPQASLTPLPLPALGAKPLVSILVANYNYERYLGQAIESVLAQGYAHFEVVVCDDGSVDGSCAVVESYARQDARIQLIRKANGGHASALNTAFAHSRGEILCLLDSDDLCLPERLVRIVDAFREHPEAGFAIHRVVRVDQNRRQQGVWPLSDSLPQGWCGPQALQAGGVLPYMPPTSGLSLRRTVAEELFPLPEEKPLGGCPDQVLMRLVPLLTPLVRVLTPLSEYRLHNANTYDTSRITAASVSRELAICEHLWQAQFQLLKDRAPTEAERLVPLESAPYVVLLRYLRAKLGGDTQASYYHHQLVEQIENDVAARNKSFWRLSVYLPQPLFRLAVNFLLRQNVLKQLIARLRRLV